jgi:hypothetical protein
MAMSEEPDPGRPQRPGVSIRDSKGIVVGDYATVFQYFSQAPAPLSSLIRVREFRALVDERTRGFVGREFVFSAIDDAIVDPDMPSGYIVVQGEPGIGKTSLLGQLVKLRGYVHHFNNAPLGITSAAAFLSNVCAQLIVRFGLEHPVLPASSTEDGGFLLRLLDEAADKPANVPLVVVVDALDEADDIGLTPGANRLFFAPSLPEGVFFVVSTRVQYDYRLLVSPRRDVYIDESDPANLADVRTFILNFLLANKDRIRPQIERWGLPEDSFVAELTNKSEGNFMYLVHVLRDIRDGAITARSVDDVRQFPQGLREYYRRHWSIMRSADPDYFQRYQEPVICLLATVREPVPLDLVIAWARRYWQQRSWQIESFDARRCVDVMNEWREFLNTDSVEGEIRYRVYHGSFQDFLKEEVGLTVYHQAISESALAKIPGLLSGT